MRLLAIIFIGVGFPGLLFSPWASAQESGDETAFIEAVREELEDKAYQTELPGPLAQDENEDGLDFKFPDWLGSLLRVVFWISVAILGVFLFYQLARYLGERDPTKQRPTGSPETPVRVVERKAGKPYIPNLDEAEDLAAKGQFGAAIHLLLLVALDRIYGFIRTPVPAPKTAREILHDRHVFKTFGRDLGILVEAVEAFLFARKQPGAKTYRACRETLDRLTRQLKEIR